MDTHIQQYLKSLELNRPTDPNVVRRVEEQLGFQFPEEYLKFLLHANGGEGPIGENYLQLWRVEDLIEDNEGYGVDEFAPGMLIIGSDGGDTAYCLDTRSQEMSFVAMPFIGMDLEEVEKCGATFHDFLTFLVEEK